METVFLALCAAGAAYCVLYGAYCISEGKRQGKQRGERDGVGTACGFLSGIARDNRLVLGKIH